MIRCASSISGVDDRKTWNPIVGPSLLNSHPIVTAYWSLSCAVFKEIKSCVSVAVAVSTGVGVLTATVLSAVGVAVAV